MSCGSRRSGAEAGGSADAVEQACERYVEATGEAHEDANAGIPLGAFDAPYVREREVGGVRKLLLRHAARVTEGTDVRAEPAHRVTSHDVIVVQ